MPFDLRTITNHLFMVAYDPYTAQQTLEMNSKPVETKKLSPAEEAFEREKAAITSYEEGWDRWDGPIWPLGTVQCHLRTSSPPHLTCKPG